MPDLSFLEGQSPWLILGVVAIIAVAWVLTKVVRQSGDTGEGKKGLAEVDNAAAYLAEMAVAEREGKRAAEDERVAALARLQDARADLAAAMSAHELTKHDLAECNRRAEDMARKAVREEERRRAEPDTGP